MSLTPELLESAVKELDQRQHALQAQVRQLQALQQEVVQLEERAKRDPEARERLMRIANIVQTDLLPLKHKLLKETEQMRRECEAHTSAAAPVASGKSDPMAPRKGRAKSRRTFI